MRPPVTAILVARNGAHVLERTIAALRAQTHAPDRVVMVNIDSVDDTRDIMREAEPDLILSLPEDTSFGEGVAEAVLEIDELDRREGRPIDGWLWLLGADNSPEYDALEELLGTVERNPSLHVTGPKQVRRGDPAVIVEYGQSEMANGRSVTLHQGELDQGQFEELSDVFAVGAGGMLVRRDTWRDLGGFDPGLPVVDDALDFCRRVWLSGGRVLLTPTARVERDGDPATLLSPSGERMSARSRIRERRKAELHRRLTASSPGGFVLRWLWLLPTAIARALWNLIRKSPGRIGPETAATLIVLFGGTGALASLRRARATQTEPGSVLDRLRVSKEDERQRRELRREQLRARLLGARTDIDFLATGGGWLLLFALTVSVALMFPILTATSLSGGALLPLSGDVAQLWSHVGYGVRDAGTGAPGVSDPFALVLAVLGTLTPWRPSHALVLLWVAAIPLAALGGWMLAARLTIRPWLRFLGGFVWMVAPPLLIALADGRPNGVIVHLALPWLLVAALGQLDTWRSLATTSLLALVIAAASPSLLPALAVLWLCSLLLARVHRARHLLLPIPTLALFLPLAVAQWNRGRPLAIVADPGVATPYEPVHGAKVLLGFPEAGFGGAADLARTLGLEAPIAIVLATLAIPFALAVLLGLFGRSSRVALVGLVMAGLGAVTAILGGNLHLTSSAADSVPVWIGAGQSLMLLGLGGLVLAGVAALRDWSSALLGTLLVVGVSAAVLAPATAVVTGGAAIAPGEGRNVPALVAAQGTVEPGLGTLILTPVDASTMRVALDRGTGDTLDAQSTLHTTDDALSPAEDALARVAVRLTSDYAGSSAGELRPLNIGYILLSPGSGDQSAALAQRMRTALGANGAFVDAGESAYGHLWRVDRAKLPATADAGAIAPESERPSVPVWLVIGMLIVQALILLAAILLALPTGTLEADASLAARPRRRIASLDLVDEARERAMHFGDIAAERVRVYEPIDGDDEDAVVTA